jgi:hypothetical protein
MATRQLKTLLEKGTHAVGNLNNLKVKTLAHGAIVEGADVDNFTIVELGFNADGERTCKQLAAKGNKSYLIASPEVRNMGEELVDFYNAVGEHARIVILEEGYTRFDTSAFTGTPAANKKAHFDVTTKKFLIHDGAHADYAGSKAKFLVVSSEDDLEYTNGAAQVRLEVIEA